MRTFPRPRSDLFRDRRGGRSRITRRFATDRGLSHLISFVTLKSARIKHGSNCQFPVRTGGP